MRLRRLRLVKFHAFEDVTIDVRGHLFLVGENGSGKTTALDAVHFALTAGAPRKMEWNAAARADGTGRGGRTLAGVVLGHEAGRGPRRPEGAVTYALVELEGDGEVLTFGAGAFARALDAEVDAWGVLHTGPLEEVPVVVEADGRQQIQDRRALAAALGDACVLAPTLYRARLADRLFGGRAGYDEAMRLVGAGKAYRLLASRARGMGALLRALLPAPESAQLAEIRAALRDLDALGVRLADLRREVARFDGLAELARALRVARSEARRWSYVQARAASGSAEASRVAAEGDRAAAAAALAEAQEQAGAAAALHAEMRASRAAAVAAGGAVLAESVRWRDRVRAAAAGLAVATAERDAARAELEEAERKRARAPEGGGAGPRLPQANGLEVAARALDAAGLGGAWRPLASLIDVAAGGDGARARLEALLGDGVLGIVVPAPAEQGRVAGCVHGLGAGALVLDTGAWAERARETADAAGRASPAHAAIVPVEPTSAALAATAFIGDLLARLPALALDVAPSLEAFGRRGDRLWLWGVERRAAPPRAARWIGRGWPGAGDGGAPGAARIAEDAIAGQCRRLAAAEEAVQRAGAQAAAAARDAGWLEEQADGGFARAGERLAEAEAREEELAARAATAREAVGAAGARLEARSGEAVAATAIAAAAEERRVQALAALARCLDLPDRAEAERRALEGAGQVADGEAAERAHRADRDAAQAEAVLRERLRDAAAWEGSGLRLVDRPPPCLVGPDGRSVEEIADARRAEIADVELVLGRQTRDLLERLVMDQLVGRLRQDVEGIERTVRSLDRRVRDLVFGDRSYGFARRLRDEHRTLAELVRTASALEPEVRDRLRGLIEARLPEVLECGEEVPALLDARQWFDFHLVSRRLGDAGDVPLAGAALDGGSGGEQAVPAYVMLMALTALAAERHGARWRPLLLDEAFVGVDTERREELLRYAERLDLGLVVASPDLDGTSEALAQATTLLVERGPAGDVHVFPFHLARGPAQAGLFALPRAGALDHRIEAGARAAVASRSERSVEPHG